MPEAAQPEVAPPADPGQLASSVDAEPIKPGPEFGVPRYPCSEDGRVTSKDSGLGETITS